MPCRHVSPCGTFHSSSGRFRLQNRSGSAPWSSTPRRRPSCASRSRSKARALRSGASAELMASKWFDKRAHLSPQQTVDGIAPFAADCARSLSGAPASTPPSAPCRADRGAGRGLCEGRYPAARRRLRAGRNRQSDPGCAAALGRREFLRRHEAEYRRDRCAFVARSAAMRISRNFSPAVSGWSASRSGIPSASTTRSRARAASPTQRKCRRALFQAQAQRRSRTRCGAPDPDRQRTRHAAVRLQRHARRQRAICRPRSA